MEFPSLSGKVVLVTGASGGIGAGTAAEFAKHGCRLALTGRDQEKLNKTATRCRDAGLPADHIFITTGDITKPGDVKKIVASCVQHYGGIDVLINAAGIIRPGQFITTNMADYDAVFNTNLRAVFVMCKEAVPHLIERKGAIVNVSSFTGIRPCYSYFTFALAEASLDQFTKALALELGPKGVRVNSVNPGVVRDTNMWTRPDAPFAKSKPADVEKIQDDLRKMYPLNRIAEVRDIAPSIVFLASERASFVHGIIMPIDGGKILTSKQAVETPAVKSM